MGQRAAIYARISTTDQSCQRQIAELTAFADPGAFYRVSPVTGFGSPIGPPHLSPPRCRQHQELKGQLGGRHRCRFSHRPDHRSHLPMGQCLHVHCRGQAPPRWPGCRSPCGRLGPATSRPHPAPSPDLDKGSPAASVLATAGSGNDRRFPSLGVKEMPSYECHPFRGGGVTSKGDMPLTTTTLFSQRAEPSPLSFGTFPKRRMGRGITRISRVRCENAKRGGASRPPLARRVGAPHERGDGGGSDPPFLAAGAPPGRVKGDRQNDTFTLPSERVAPSTVIPAGRQSS